ncbi:hypothetical protein JTB14_011733 [Gonioctena quinquepunctata]|nr:hypothetical protein JTB14_011733 [Gonioctena quinquepunctata]
MIHIADDAKKFGSLSECNEFQCTGGKDTSDTTRRILNRLMTNELAVITNWTGRNNKNGFKDMKNIINSIHVSVRNNPLIQSPTLDEVENVIKYWLPSASDREGGRKASTKEEIVLTLQGRKNTLQKKDSGKSPAHQKAKENIGKNISVGRKRQSDEKGLTNRMPTKYVLTTEFGKVSPNMIPDIEMEIQGNHQRRRQRNEDSRRGEKKEKKDSGKSPAHQKAKENIGKKISVGRKRQSDEKGLTNRMPTKFVLTTEFEKVSPNMIPDIEMEIQGNHQRRRQRNRRFQKRREEKYSGCFLIFNNVIKVVHLFYVTNS